MSNFRNFSASFKIHPIFYLSSSSFANIPRTFASVPANIPRKKIKNPYIRKYLRPAQSDPPPNRKSNFGHFAPGCPRNLNPHRPQVQTIGWDPRDPQSLKIWRKSPRPISRYWGSNIFFQSSTPQKRARRPPVFSQFFHSGLRLLRWRKVWEKLYCWILRSHIRNIC